MYTGSEGVGSVEICAVSSDELSRAANIGIQAGTGGTAESQKGLDVC